jgi:cytochrome c oxidase subunit 3
MPTIGDRVEIERKPKLGGGGPGKIPHRRGYGGGDDGDHGGRDDFQSPRQRLYRLRILMGMCLFSVTILFVALTIAYVFRLVGGRYDQDTHRQVQDWIPLHLPYLQMWINTIILVLSSATLEMARRGMARTEEFAVLGIVPPTIKRGWLEFTVVLGLCFLAGQVLVWRYLQQHGVFRAFNPSQRLFYVVTGVHAAHLALGLVALLYVALGRNWMAMRYDSQRIAVEVTGWYWHYLTFLWFGIFALVHFARG